MPIFRNEIFKFLTRMILINNIKKRASNISRLIFVNLFIVFFIFFDKLILIISGVIIKFVIKLVVRCL